MIRMATPEDADAIADIYAPYVRDSAISFEAVPPTAQEMRSRLTATLTRRCHAQSLPTRTIESALNGQTGQWSG